MSDSNPVFDIVTIRNATRRDEEARYDDLYKHNVVIDGTIIGYAVYNNWHAESGYALPRHPFDTYWCGYCYVPNYWFDNAVWEDFKCIPAITHIDSNKNIIGWDHAHGYDRIYYSNLAAVITEITNVWKCTQQTDR